MTKDKLDYVRSKLSTYLEEKPVKKVRVLDVSTTLFSTNPFKISQRQLDLAITRCLKELGYKKKRTMKFNVWVKNNEI